jgi:hypothetical protein
MNEQFDLNDLRSEGQCHQHILGEICFGGREKVSDPLQTDNLKPQQFAKLLVPFIDRNWPVKVPTPAGPYQVLSFLISFASPFRESCEEKKIDIFFFVLHSRAPLFKANLVIIALFRLAFFFVCTLCANSCPL